MINFETMLAGDRALVGCAGSRAGRAVVIAPDKFKGTLTAAQAAAHVAAGLRRARGADLAIRQVPVADGGDGTVAAALAAGYQPVRLTVRGPCGQPVSAEFARRDGTAVIEAAQACGLARLTGPPRPLTATSYGAGQLIAAAAAMGARRIVLGLGGVASTDGGAGMVQALGGRLLDRDGRELPPGGAALAALHRLDLTAMTWLPGIELLVASDVNNPLLGGHGAAAVYGPQKGASAADVTMLETGLARWADVAERVLAGQQHGKERQYGEGQQHGEGRQHGEGQQHGQQRSAGITRRRDEPGAGAAGGLGFAALAFLAARIRPGIELILDMISFTDRLAGARLVITGEGSLDAQTLRGKAPAGVARAVAAAAAAAAARLPVIAVAGSCTLTPAQLRGAGIDAAYTLSDIEPDLGRCLANAGPLLEEAASRLAADWLPAAGPGSRP